MDGPKVYCPEHKFTPEEGCCAEESDGMTFVDFAGQTWRFVVGIGWIKVE